MKILAILSVYLFGFGLVCQETTRVEQPKAHVVKQVVAASAAKVEAPVMDVLLDTVEISVTAPVAIASAK
ncbi:hypothetical protein [Pontibacter liquoris]|uniref:hypothetical protein n=1 Tax=Pontibacter liquoris TaxID=2905677 RepID=UPI001FA8112D|nr:hypothetical protein [Pontibacter liquoris]